MIYCYIIIEPHIAISVKNQTALKVYLSVGGVKPSCHISVMTCEALTPLCTRLVI